MKKIFLLLLVGISLSFRVFDNTAQTLPFSQNWTNTAMITANDNWSGVPGIEGFLGQDITTTTGTDPQTLLTMSGLANDLDVIANQTNTNNSTGGVAEFDGIANPTIALQGSGTADAPFILMHLNTTGMNTIPIQYNLRDIDGTADNAVQPVALQYRVGNAGNFTNIPAGFVADATTGPSLATLVTPVNTFLPPACDNQPLVQVRVITSNAPGSDEWVGIDDIQIGGAAAGNVALTAGTNAAEAPVPTNGTFTVTFTPITPGPVTLDYSLNTGTATFNTDFTVTLTGGASPSPLVAPTGTINAPGGTTTFTITITPIDDLISEGNETVSLVLSSPSGGYVASPSSATINISDDDIPTTLIHTIQGSGTTATPGNFRVEGIVTGVYPTLSPAGFYMQEEDADADADVNTSEGIFVVSNAAVNPGDVVRVIGTVLEGGASPSFNQAVIHTVTVTVLSAGNPLPTVQVIFLPVSSLNEYERSEAMMVRFNGPFTVTNNENLGNFGEISISAGGLVSQPTQMLDPNDNPPGGTNSTGNSNAAAITALANSNVLRTILLDDGRGIIPATLPYVDGNNTLRVGSTINVVPGILGFAFSQWRIQPMNGPLPVFTHAARPAVPSVGGGNLKIASFNVLNYFNGNGAGGGFPTSRGAHSLAEFNRQRDKIINAIIAMNPDLLAVIEMENLDLNDVRPALLDLVDGLNLIAGPGVYAFTDDDLDNNGSQDFNTDQIRTAHIYKPAVLVPVGNAMISPDPVFERPPLAQTFNLLATNKKFNFISNHFKSKGCGGAAGLDLDQNDGQGCFNNSRKLQAAALSNFINTIVIPTSGTNRIVTVGDYNAYYQEDPIDILRAAGYTTPDNANDYSYLFGGALGSLDHVLLSPSLVGTLTGIAKWNTNSVEPSYLDYEDAINDGGGDVVNPWAATYTVSPWRSSDHDAVLLGLNLDIALPLSFDFTAVKLSNTSKLSWTTNNETNTKSFVVERSIDNGSSWQVISTVAAAGNNNSLLNYSIIDSSPANGINLYRIKIIRWDEQFNYSAVRKINFSKKYSYSLYPNPASDFIQVSSDNATGIHAEIRVLSSIGQVLLSKKVDKNNGQVLLDISGLVSGFYFIHISEAGGTVVVEKFSKQ